MLKAGAFIYALLLSTLITLTCSAFIFSDYLEKKVQLTIYKKAKMEADLNSALNLYLAGGLDFQDKKKIQLFDDPDHEVSIQIKNWGAFTVFKAKAKWKSVHISKKAMIGANIFTNEKVALYLADHGKPLSLSGNSNLQGTCYLPRSGIERAYIEGVSYQRDKLVHGSKKQSKKRIPELNPKLSQINPAQMNGKYSDSKDSIRYFSDFEKTDSISHGFDQKPLILLMNEESNIFNKVISGNVILYSKKPLEIHSSSILSEVLIYAPSVRIRSGFKGNIQVFADDSIRVESGSKLHYPSILGVVGKLNKSSLILERNSQISGCIFIHQKILTRNTIPYMKIGKNSQVEGQVYNSGHTELKGSIHGSIYTYGFILNTPSSVYENHLLNASINYNKLSPHFSGIALINKNKTRRVVKWLD